jgi:hypothetical protein
MAVDSCLNVLGKVGIDGGCRIFGKHGDSLGDCAAHGMGSMENGHRFGIVLDDDFRACSDASQQRSQVARCFLV